MQLTSGSLILRVFLNKLLLAEHLVASGPVEHPV